MLAGFDNPVIYLFDEAAYDRGELIVANVIPYSDAESLSPEQLDTYQREGFPLEFSHTLDEQIGGQLEAGFVIAGFYEDRPPPEENDPLSKYMATFIATRAIKKETY